nr:lipocalin family protein [Dyella sp. ASV24]
MVLAAHAAHPQPLPNQPVARLDLGRYMGQWHEIAHLPLVFQRQCVSDVTAEYTATEDGQIRVRNACRTRDGSLDTAIGVARTVRPGPEGALQVRFAPDCLSWLPWAWADYWVVEIDPGYQWAVVGSPSRRYLWILSRSPDMTRAQFEAIRSRATLRGYALGELRVDAPLR